MCACDTKRTLGMYSWLFQKQRQEGFTEEWGVPWFYIGLKGLDRNVLGTFLPGDQSFCGASAQHALLPGDTQWISRISPKSKEIIIQHVTLTSFSHYCLGTNNRDLVFIIDHLSQSTGCSMFNPLTLEKKTVLKTHSRKHYAAHTLTHTLFLFTHIYTEEHIHTCIHYQSARTLSH